MLRIFTSLAFLTVATSCKTKYLQLTEIDTASVEQKDIFIEDGGTFKARTYTYSGDVPVVFNFSDNAAIVSVGSNFSQPAANIFLRNGQVATTDSLYAARRFGLDSVSFTSGYENIFLNRAAHCIKNGREYLLFQFRKHELGISPYERSYYYLFDITRKDNVKAIGFLASDVNPNNLPAMWFGGKGLHIACDYWSPDDKIIRTLWLEQYANRQWFPAHTVVKEGL